MKQKKRIKSEANLSEREKAINTLNICKQEELNKVPLRVSSSTTIMVCKKLTKSQREAKRQHWQTIYK